MAGAVASAAKALPAEVVKPITDACTNVTTELKGVVGQICEDTTTKVSEATKSACSTLGSTALTYASNHGDIQTMKLLHQYEAITKPVRTQHANIRQSPRHTA